MPEWLNLYAACYEIKTKFIMRTEANEAADILSGEGVHQGCPLGPALFCLGLRRADSGPAPATEARAMQLRSEAPRFRAGSQAELELAQARQLRAEEKEAAAQPGGGLPALAAQHAGVGVQRAPWQGARPRIRQRAPARQPSPVREIPTLKNCEQGRQHNMLLDMQLCDDLLPGLEKFRHADWHAQ